MKCEACENMLPHVCGVCGKECGGPTSLHYHQWWAHPELFVETPVVDGKLVVED